MSAPWMLASDLSPGDRRSLECDGTNLSLHVIRSSEDPLFKPAYRLLWEEFGEKAEIETADVLSDRLTWTGGSFERGIALRYEMMVVRDGEKIAAVLDQTAMLPDDAEHVYVHISHCLVMPPWRRSGLAGWIRVLPLQTARRLLHLHSLPSSSPITLVAELEPPNANDAFTLARLRAYERGGFLLLDPAFVPYSQPDLRPADLAVQTKPLPLLLLLRRMHQPEDGQMPSQSVRVIVNMLFHMYAQHCSASAMEVARRDWERLRARQASIRLLTPSSG